jgi:type IV secretion system protein VirB3
MSDISIHQEFPTYGGLSRVAMIFGVPIMALVGLLVCSMFLILIATMFIGQVAYFLLIPIFFILVFIKYQSETDDQAMRILGLELLWYFRKTNINIWGRNLTILPIKYGRHRYVVKRLFKQYF